MRQTYHDSTEVFARNVGQTHLLDSNEGVRVHIPCLVHYSPSTTTENIAKFLDSPGRRHKNKKEAR